MRQPLLSACVQKPCSCWAVMYDKVAHKCSSLGRSLVGCLGAQLCTPRPTEGSQLRRPPMAAVAPCNLVNHSYDTVVCRFFAVALLHLVSYVWVRYVTRLLADPSAAQWMWSCVWQHRAVSNTVSLWCSMAGGGGARLLALTVSEKTAEWGMCHCSFNGTV
jgi:hypothetical protein